jgi:pimeloyl-ACP methyl ester carboxylesterase
MPILRILTVRRIRWVFIALYLVALALSHLVTAGNHFAMPARSVQVPIGGAITTAATKTNSAHTATLAYAEWAAATPDAPVVVLLHGSPGDGSNFAQLAPLLVADAYRVIAPDLLGFGKSTLRVPDHSIHAQSRAVLSLLEQLGVERAHVVGWSNGGGAAMWLAADKPAVIQTLTLMGSIGEQRFEGSGSYYVEHAKYAVGFALIGGLPELVPHFGLLGTYATRTGWLHNFADSDQREIAGLYVRLRENGVASRTLILHGAGDVLVRLTSARSAHSAMPASKLVVLDANHFLPLQQSTQTADTLNQFFRDKLTQTVTESPLARSRTGLLWLVDQFRNLVRATPWWLHVIAIAALAVRRPAWAVMLAGLAIASDFGPGMDIFVAFVGLLLGMALWTLKTILVSRRHHDIEPSRAMAGWNQRLERAPLMEGWNAGLLHSWRPEACAGLWSATGPRARLSRTTYCVALVLWCVISLIAAIVAFIIIEHGFAEAVHGWSAFIASLTMLLGFLKVGWSASRFASLLSPRGWRFAQIAVERLIHFEYWPTWFVYLPLLPGMLWLAAKHRRLLAFTATNPAIVNAGGFVGESKIEIIRDLGSSQRVARTALIPSAKDASERLTSAIDLMRGTGIAYPAILKPNEGQRGHAVKLAKSPHDIDAYIAANPHPFLIQAFAKGPHECGVLWCRHAGNPNGFLFSITAKEFPIIEGDGVHTLEELIERHPRYRRQHRTFLTRFASEVTRVLAKGERMSLGVAGNHCQGTKFLDGAHLITPELTRVIEAICRDYARDRFASNPLGGLDWVRFDIRYESDDLLRQGEGFTIVEMNGSSAESTNIYDPSRSLLWSYSVLWNQWKQLFALGHERMTTGVDAVNARELLALSSAHTNQRTGSSIAD